MVLSVRCLQHTWIGFKSYDKKCFGLSTLLKFTPRSLAHQKQSGLCWTLGTSGACRALSCVNTPLVKPIMETAIMQPPQTVRGMIELDRGAFQKKISVPHVTGKVSEMGGVLKNLKKYILKLEKFLPVKTIDNDAEKKEILLNPTLVENLEDIKEQLSQISDEEETAIAYKEISVGYENWKAEEILKSVLPDDQSGSQGFSRVGHILHLNLRDHLLPYKTLIGEVYLDKVPDISMVVNKLNTIDSTYRTFQMEILAGSGETTVTVKENGCSYELDFARVYWNPRLATEHGRVVGRLRHGDVLYDIMAGVGPFAIPAGRKKCRCVLANDLNPDSFDALVKNCTRNKVKDRVKCSNMDAHDFIQTILKADLEKRWTDSYFTGTIYVTMNLPAMAVTFLSSFRGLMYGVQGVSEDVKLPVIHVYMFTKDTAEDNAIARVAENLGYPPKPSETVEDEVVEGGEGGKSKSHRRYESLRKHIEEVIHVRQVAPNKAMMRVTFQLPLEVLMEECDEEPVCKKIKTS